MKEHEIRAAVLARFNALMASVGTPAVRYESVASGAVASVGDSVAPKSVRMHRVNSSFAISDQGRKLDANYLEDLWKLSGDWPCEVDFGDLIDGFRSEPVRVQGSGSDYGFVWLLPNRMEADHPLSENDGSRLDLYFSATHKKD